MGLNESMVLGRNPANLSCKKINTVMSTSHCYQGRWQSGLMHQTVNLAAKAFGGSNPSLPTFFKKLNYQYVRKMFAVVAQLVEHQPSMLRVAGSNPVRRSISLGCSSWANGPKIAYVAQSVEHVLGKDEVTGSIPVVGSKINFTNKRRYFNG